MINANIVLVVGVQLIDNVNGLGGHPQLRHKRVISNYLFLLKSCLGDQVIELHSQKDLTLVIEIYGELLGNRVEILLFVQGLSEELAQLRIDGVRIIVAEESKAGIDLSFEQLALDSGKRRKHLDERREQIGTLSDCARLTHETTHHPAARRPGSGGEKKEAFNPALGASGSRRSDY